MSKKIVTIGGGTGQPTLLRAVRDMDVDVTAIVTMMDDGGSSGVLRQQYGVLPPGDVRRCLLALSHTPEVFSWWEHRFEGGDLAGHVAGNMVLASLFQTRPVQVAIDQVAMLMQVRGRVLAVTEELSDLCATLSDGTIIRGEDAIPQHDSNAHITDLFLDPVPKLNPHVPEAIASADAIVLCMGDLYTSVVLNLLVPGLTQALVGTTAPIIAICNRSARQGETAGFTTTDFASVIGQYLAPARLTTFIVDDGSVPLPADALPITQAPLPADIQVITTDLSDPNNLVLLSGEKAAAILEKLI